MTDQELKTLVGSLATSHTTLEKVLAKNSEEIKASQAKVDVQLAKTDAQLAKTDAQLAKTDAQLAKTDAQLADLAKQLGGYTDTESKKSESRYAKSLAETMTIDGIHYDSVEKNVWIQNREVQTECDIIMRNDVYIFVIEVKHKPKSKIFKQLMRQREVIEQIYPRYKKGIRLGIAGEIISPKILDQAKEFGIYIIQEKGGTLNIITPMTA